jgi:hypothetical protein
MTLPATRRRGFALADVRSAAGDAQKSQQSGCGQSEVLHKGFTSSRRASFTPRLVPSLVRKRHIFTKSVGDLDRPAGFAAGQSGIGLSLLSGGGISVANSTPDPLGIDLQALEVAHRGFFLTQRGGASPAPPRTTAKKRAGVISPEVLWQKPWGS